MARRHNKRALDIPLEGVNLNKDVAEFLQTRDDHQLRCQRVLDSLDTGVADLDRRIADVLVCARCSSRFRHKPKNHETSQRKSCGLPGELLRDHEIEFGAMGDSRGELLRKLAMR